MCWEPRSSLPFNNFWHLYFDMANEGAQTCLYYLLVTIDLIIDYCYSSYTCIIKFMLVTETDTPAAVC